MENEFYNLTHRQKEIWYMEKLYPNTSIGVIGGIFRMKGITDFSLFSRAINNFIKNNDAMRFRLLEVEGEAKQYVSEFKPCDIEFMDFSNKPIEEFYAWEQEQTLKPMELIDTPLFRFVMMKFSEDEGGFYIKIHHTISDAWSMTILVNEIAENYFALKNGTYEDKEKPSYISYIKKEEEYNNTERCKKDKEYWMKKYEEEPEIARLKEKTTKNISTKAKRKTFVLPDKLCKKIYEYSKENKISVFSMYMTALSIYINRIKGKNKINVGTIILNRADKAEKNTMGMFVTTAPVLLDIDNNDNFMNFSKNVTKEMMSLMRHQSYPFDVLQEEVREKFKMDEVLYDVVLSYQNAKFLDKNSENEYKTRWSFCGHQTSSLIIHINDRDNDNKLIVDYDYLADLFYDKEIEFIHKHIEAVLWHALDNPQKPMKNLNMVSEKERNKLLYGFNNTDVDYEKDATVYELIEKTAKENPDKKAIVFEDSIITYKELMDKSNIVARKLKEYGIEPNTIVGIMANRSIDMMVSLLGIIKSGAAYLPIDPEYPQDRIEYMLSDSKAKILLTENKYKDSIKNENIEKLIIDDKEFYVGSNESLGVVNKPDDLLYMIYTSGSTGLPKGVMLTHKNVNNFVKGMCDVIDFSPNKNIASVTTISFDIFVLESWLALQKGLTIVLANEDEQNNSKSFNEMCVKNDVNMVQTTPSRMGILTGNKKYLDFAENITDFMVGGEPFPKDLLDRLKSISKAKIYNVYGPTETTVWSSVKDLTNENKINIGRPIANTKMYIFDSNMNLCPIGIMGDLYIGGDGLAKGYFEREELNKDRFIKNPYNPDEIIYKTGDLAKWMANGEIIHLGRSDSQVKIRGYRIELGDIEKNIMLYENIKNVAIKIFDNKYIVAYVIADLKIDFTKLKRELQKKLPQYMIPNKFIVLEKFSYTPNGKIDYKGLPKPDFEIENNEIILPSNETEKILYDVIKKVLNLETLSITDDFLEVGADSLSFLNIQTELFIYDFGLTTQNFYEYSNIQELAKFIDQKGIN